MKNLHSTILPLILSSLLFVSIASAEESKNYVNFQNQNATNARALTNKKIKRISTQRLGNLSVEEASMNFLEKYQEDMGIHAPANELKFIESTQDSIGMLHVKYQQVLSGIPVEGSNLILHMSQDFELIGVNGSYKKIDKLQKFKKKKLAKRKKRLAKRLPIKRAKKFMRRKIAKGAYRVRSVSQVVFNPQNFQLEGTAKFAWKIELFQDPVNKAVQEGGIERNARILYVRDAKRQRVLFNYDPTAHQSAPDRLIRDCACGSPQSRCCQAVPFPSLNYTSGRAEGDMAVGPNPFDWTFGDFETLGLTDIDQTYDHLGNLHQMVFDKFGRNGGNNFGGTGKTATLLTYTDASNHAEVSNDAVGIDATNCSAQFSSAGVIVLCSGQTVPDIVGHEYGHSLSTSLTWNGTSFSRLANFSQAGSLAESFSDFLGEIYQNYLEGSNDWLLETKENDFLRSFRDPTEIFNDFLAQNPPDRFHSENYYCGGSGNGGIHINAGVPNKAIYLMSEGGSFNGCSIEGIGIEKVEQVWYRALTTYFVPNETFNSAYVNVLQSCNDLYSEEDCKEVEKALQAVEMDQAGACSGQAVSLFKSACRLKDAGDVNQDGFVNFQDINPFITFLISGDYLAEADVNEDGIVDFQDISPFIDVLLSA